MAAADALLDRLRDRGTFEGGLTAPQDGCWIHYNSKAVWLEDRSEFSAALRAAEDATATDHTQPWHPIRPKVVVKVTWARAAAYGARLPQGLRSEMEALRRTEHDEHRTWSEFSDARGGWPWRRRFATDEDHQVAVNEWDAVYAKHLGALREVRAGQKAAIAHALPLTVDDEPVDLLELLDQQSATPATSSPSVAMQAGALRAAAASAPAAARGDEALTPQDPVAEHRDHGRPAAPGRGTSTAAP